MLKFQIDSLLIRDFQTPIATNYILQGVDGIEAPGYRIGTYENPGQDGGTVGSAFYGSRTVTLTGQIDCPDATTYQAARQALAYACRIQKDANNFPIPTHFTLTTLDGLSYFFDGVVTSFKATMNYPSFGDFLVVVQVPDPLLYGSALSTSSTVSVPALGGVIYPVTYPAIYAGSTGGSGTISLSGNAFSWPIITLTAGLTSPRLYNIERGKVMALTYGLTGSDTVVIDMKQKTIMLNGTTSLLSYRTDDSDWFSLQPGVNTFSLSTSSTSDTGSAVITSYSGYLGV